MKNKLVMPAGCSALTCDEMTYTQGGGIFGLAAGALLIYNYAWGLNETRNWLKKNKTGSAVTTGVKAYHASIDYVGSSLLNTVRGVITAMQFSALWPLTAVAWLTVKSPEQQSTASSSSVSSSAAYTSTTTSKSATKIVELP